MKLTKAWLKKHRACEAGVNAFLAQKERNSVKILKLLIKSNQKEKLQWANWLIPKLFRNKQQKIAYAIFAAKLALPIFEKEYPNDLRPRQAIEATETYLKAPTKKNKDKCRDAAYAAANAADAANAAYYAATNAANAARAAAYATYAANTVNAARAARAAHTTYAAYYAAADAAYANSAAYAAYNQSLITILNYGLTLLIK